MCIRPAIECAKSAGFEQNYETAEIGPDPTMASNKNTRARLERNGVGVRLPDRSASFVMRNAIFTEGSTENRKMSVGTFW
jgi:hypothetical protein